MTTAICIGSYKAPDFVELNACQCLKFFEDAAILISDDLSPQSETIKAISDRLGCAYTVTDSRRGRCGGWIQALVNGLSFAEQESVEVLLLLGHRFVPASPEFVDTVLIPFRGSKIGAVSFERPAEFLALRVDLISPDEVLERYRVAMRHGRYHPDASIPDFAEHIVTTLKKIHVEAVGEGQYLSHKTATPADYIALASPHGITGAFDCRPWAMIEGPEYVGRAEAV